jgi:putative pyruvate formate lyase activating enzyme
MIPPYLFKKENSKFESFDVWKQLSDGGDNLSWYFAVSTNRMPAKYLISKSIFSNLTNLKTATEEMLWDEHTNLMGTFLDTWKEIRSGEHNIICSPATGKTSLVDLNTELTKRMLRHCNFCRWNCQIDRSSQSGTDGSEEEAKKHGTCQLESTSKVSSYFHHLGEELVFRGTMGSGTIFFTSCNMRCSFCQNGDISTDKDNGIQITPSLLSLMIWQLRLEGCHNTNWVGGDPTIHLHTIVEAIGLLDSLKISTVNNMEQYHQKYVESIKSDSYACRFKTIKPKYLERAFYQKKFFNTPQLWNSNFFMSSETMHVLRSFIDVWLPDFKFGPGKCSVDIARTPWYWDTITKNLMLIHEWGEDFVIRHLIMPNHFECCTKPTLEWIASNMPEVPVNIMDQYYPDNLCDPRSPKYRERYNEIARSPTEDEILKSYQYAKELGLNFEALSYEKSVFGLNV